MLKVTQTQVFKKSEATSFITRDPVEITISKFPAGETLLRVKEFFRNSDNRFRLNIALLWESNNDLFNLLLLVDACRRMHPGENIEFTLYIPYFPYARQDRVCSPGESFSLKVAADLINSIGFKSVTVLDPHSDVTPALINNVNVIDSSESVIKITNNYLGDGLLVSPDAGADKKVGKIARSLGQPYISCSKVRDPKTGALSGCQVHSEHLGSKNLLVVDDICDGGGTFVMLAEELKKKTDGKIMLYVTHGIFSKGLAPLLINYDNIYTANNMSGIVHPRLHEV